jgi:ABC-type transport system involved in multi-copper enzyme maturation permease subunit
MFGDLNWIAWVGVAVGAALALTLLGFLLVGLFQARSLVRREFTAYFISPVAYAILFIFLLVTGYAFTKTLGQLTAAGPQGAEYPMQYMLMDANPLFWAVFFFIPALLTMRLFAEERNTGTLEMLMTAPLKDWQFVAAKFVACFGFYVFLWLPTLLYLPALLGLKNPEFKPIWTIYSITLLSGLAVIVLGALLAVIPAGTRIRLVALFLLIAGAIAAGVGGWGHYFQDPGPDRIFEVTTLLDPMPVVTTYLGLALAGAMLLAIGLFISSLVKNQQVAALLSAAVGLIAFLFTGVYQPGFALSGFFSSASAHFSQDFCRGLIDTRHVTLYLSVTLYSLFLTVRSLEGRRWH